MIEVRLFATLRENRDKILYLAANDFRDGTSIIQALNIEPSEVAIFLINGIHSKLDDHIKEKDIVAIFPPVGGG